jgi:Pyridoxamine 5'-phosphate oxidase
MSVFSQAETDFLTSQTLARLATSGGDCKPHIIPVTFWFNEDEDAIDVEGIDFAAGKKYEDPAAPDPQLGPRDRGLHPQRPNRRLTDRVA